MLRGPRKLGCKVSTGTTGGIRFNMGSLASQNMLLEQNSVAAPDYNLCYASTLNLTYTSEDCSGARNLGFIGGTGPLSWPMANAG